MKKKIVALILVAGMVSSSLLGCVSNAPPASSGETTANADVQEGDAEEEAAEEGAAEQGSENAVLDVFINHSWYPVDSFTGIIPDYIKEQTGIDLNVTIATNSDQLGLMIASGDLPDIVFSDLEIDRLSNPNLTISYSELEEKHGADFSGVREKAIDIARTFSSDGDYYTLLNNFSTSEEWAELEVGANGQGAMFYRRDLLDALGINGDEITSVGRLYEVLETVKEEYPERTAFGLGGTWKFQALSNAMGVMSSQFNPDTGEYYYASSAPKYHEFMVAANKMFRDGFITAEQYAAENEADNRQHSFNDGNVFYNWYLSYDSLTQLQNETEKLHPDAEWAILPFLGDSTKDFGRGWSGAFVSRNVSNPEAAAKLLTYLHSEEGRRASIWGREGIDYELDENNIPWFSDEFLEARAAGELVQVYNWRFNFGSTAIEEMLALNGGVEQEVLDAITTYNKAVENFPEVNMATPANSSPQGVTFANLEELRRTHEAKIIFTSSDEEFEQAYEEFMTVLDASGVQEYNEHMTNAIREVRENLGW